MPSFTAMASKIYLREVEIPKSRTFSALNFQVFFLSEKEFSLAMASACVTIITGLSYDVCAFAYLETCSGEKTSALFIKFPVASMT